MNQEKKLNIKSIKEKIKMAEELIRVCDECPKKKKHPAIGKCRLCEKDLCEGHIVEKEITFYDITNMSWWSGSFNRGGNNTTTHGSKKWQWCFFRM